MLDSTNFPIPLDRETYERELLHHQQLLAQLSEQTAAQKRPAVVVCEGWDAADWAIIIERITEQLDPGRYVVYGQLETDKEHHYLYPFWRRLPARGQIAFFIQSWYRRVLSDRIKSLCTEGQWTRAYREINAFERQLVNFGMILVKYWIHISPDEQQHRLERRDASSLAKDRILGDIAQRSAYEKAVDEMLLQTSTLTASWTVIDGDDSPSAQIRTLSSLVNTFAKKLDHRHRDPVKKSGGKKKKKKKKHKQKKKSKKGKKK